MRTKLAVMALVLVASSQTGCRQCAKLALACAPELACPPPSGLSVPSETAVPSAPAPQPEVEVRGSETIHVKAPAQKITVTLPPNCEVAPGAGEGCAPGWPEFAPGMPQAPVIVPQAPAMAPQSPAMAPQAPAAPMSYAPVMAPTAPAGLMGTSQTVKQKHRLALSLEYIRIPLPYPKLMSLPGEQEVVTRQTYQAPAYAPVMAPAAPVAYAPVAPQPVQYAPVAQAPVQYAPVAQAPPVQYAPVAAPPVQYAPVAPPPVQYAPVAPPPVQYAPVAPPPQAALVPTTLQGMICIPSTGNGPCPPPCPPPCPATPPCKPHR
jgi:hypothetical protein